MEKDLTIEKGLTMSFTRAYYDLPLSESGLLVFAEFAEFELWCSDNWLLIPKSHKHFQISLRQLR
jgi:hypothetical protein